MISANIQAEQEGQGRQVWWRQQGHKPCHLARPECELDRTYQGQEGWKEEVMRHDESYEMCSLRIRDPAHRSYWCIMVSPRGSGPSSALDGKTSDMPCMIPGSQHDTLWLSHGRRRHCEDSDMIESAERAKNVAVSCNDIWARTLVFHAGALCMSSIRDKNSVYASSNIPGPS